MDEIRIGLAGLGRRGLGWLHMLQRIDGFRVAAICDPVVPLHEAALDLLDEHSQVNTYASYEDMLGDPRVDAVALCVRCEEQGALAAMALEAGKHVNAEVPAAHTVEDCWRIVVAAERTGLVYQLAEQTRHWGFVDAWRDMVSEGRLGRVVYCEGQYFGYYGAKQFYWDPETGRHFGLDELSDHPEARPNWRAKFPPIHYLPHELSPMLKVLGDRVIEVTAMSTGSPSYSHSEVPKPDMQVALMKTERDAILRMATGFTQPVSHDRGHHWYQVIGTRGSVEWKRSGRGCGLMWTAGTQMHDMAEMNWRLERTDAPSEAKGFGHNEADYYVHVAFRDAVLGLRPLGFDVYQAIDTALPAILAAESIDSGSMLIPVPDPRPSDSRPRGALPS